MDHCSTHNISSFSDGVLVSAGKNLKIRAYQFDGYAARLQSVAGYFARSMELLDPVVRAQLFAADRPIKTKDQSNPSTYYGPGAKSINSLVADGCIIEGEVENSILFRGVKIGMGARVKNCVLMQDTVIEAGASVEYAVTDKNVTITKGKDIKGTDTFPVYVAKYQIV